jgi:hypothetical protein
LNNEVNETSHGVTHPMVRGQMHSLLNGTGSESPRAKTTLSKHGTPGHWMIVSAAKQHPFHELNLNQFKYFGNKIVKIDQAPIKVLKLSLLIDVSHRSLLLLLVSAGV